MAAKKIIKAEIKIRITDLFNKTNLINLKWIKIINPKFSIY
jgi:hypothetical protein